MQYQFFIREQPKAEGGTQSYLIIVPAYKNEAMAQTSMQALITRHQMHTCVNLPFGSGYNIRFRLSYADMDGSPHPVLVIISSHQGAFKLPFQSGRTGYAHFHKMFKRLKIALTEHRNKKALRLSHQNANAKRLGHAQAESDTQAESWAATVNGGSRPVSRSRQAPSQEKAKPQTRTINNRRPAANEPGTRRSSSKHAPKAPGRNASSFMKWTIGTTVTVSVVLILLLSATSAMASEPPVQARQSHDSTDNHDGQSFAGFPVPAMDLKPIQASHASACAVPGFDRNELPGLTQATTDNGNR